MSNTYNAWKNIRHFIKNTPLVYSERLSAIYNTNIYLKREDLQLTRSFKIRGCLNKINNLSNAEKNKGLVCASAGNHAQGFAHICNKLDINGKIFLPSNTPTQKINRIKYFGKDNTLINLVGNTVDESIEEAINYSNKNDKTFIHPFNDKDIIYGQGTIGYEIFNKINPDIIISCIGGGGLISGISNYLYENNLKCDLYGCEPELASSMIVAKKEGKPVKLKNISTFVDGASVSMVGDIPFNLLKNNLRKIFPINEGELCNELLKMYQEDGIILEPAGALSICGINKINNIKNKNIVCILSGGNNDITRYPEMIEKNMVYLGLRHYYIIDFNQNPGQLKKFVNNILGKNDDITRFEYIKKTNTNYGNVLLGIESENFSELEENLLKNNFEFQKIEPNDLIYSYLI